MSRQTFSRPTIFLTLFLLLPACGVLQPAPTPDRVATGVAEARAIAATLTAQAPTVTPIPPPATQTATAVPSTATQTATPVPPTITPTRMPPTSTPTVPPVSCIARDGLWRDFSAYFIVSKCTIAQFTQYTMLNAYVVKSRFFQSTGEGFTIFVVNNEFSYQKPDRSLNGIFTSPIQAHGTWTDQGETGVWSANWVSNYPP